VLLLELKKSTMLLLVLKRSMLKGCLEGCSHFKKDHTAAVGVKISKAGLIFWVVNYFQMTII
jgi:hypothetical protein